MGLQGEPLDSLPTSSVKWFLKRNAGCSFSLFLLSCLEWGCCQSHLSPGPWIHPCSCPLGFPLPNYTGHHQPPILDKELRAREQQ